MDNASDSFKDQVKQVMDKHDGLSLILEYYNCPPEVASEVMIMDFLDKLINDENFKQQLKEDK